jgi:hypothetical protein
MSHPVDLILTEDARAQILRSYGAKDDVLSELLAYNHNNFERLPEFDNHSYPLPDEPFVNAWNEYLHRSQETDAWTVLKTCLRHLNFPIQHGIRQHPLYQAVMKKGDPVINCPLATGLTLHNPKGIHLRMESTIAGHIPVIVVNDRSDFETLLQALLNSNEPMTIPPSMGAVMVAGYNNWDRIEQYKLRWHQQAQATEVWIDEFKRLISKKSLYQDRFIIVSSGPYSNVSAANLGLNEEVWLQLSVEIRIAHECTHYAMKRIYGQMRNNLQDEFIADAVGLICATGQFKKDWFLHFMGLENPGMPRPDGRMSVYRGNPPLSEAAFHVLQTMLAQAGEQMEAFFPAGTHPQTAVDQIMEKFATATLEALSGERRCLA